jgi:hypothetical protein
LPGTPDLALLFVLKRIARTEGSLVENPGAAKDVLQLFLNISGQMDDSIRAVENQTSAEELKSFKRGAGHVMYEVFERILEPICKRHPSLRPPEMEGSVI